MTTLILRNLDDDLHTTLRLRAAQHGQSLEEEACGILRQVLTPPPQATPLGQRLVQRFRGVAADLPLPPRVLPRTPPLWDEPT